MGGGCTNGTFRFWHHSKCCILKQRCNSTISAGGSFCRIRAVAWQQLGPNLHQNLWDTEFPALIANTGYSYFRKTSPYCKTEPKKSKGKTIHPNYEPFRVQQFQYFQGTARLGRDQSSCTQQRMMIIKETLNLALWGSSSGQQLVMPITHHIPGVLLPSQAWIHVH